MIAARYGDDFLGRVLIDSAMVILADPATAAEGLERTVPRWGTFRA